MDIRAKLIEVQKSRKRRLPINDSSELSDVQLPEKNLEENNEENLEANLIKFEQGVTNKGNVALWHNDKNSNYWRCSNKDCPAKTKAIQKGGQFIGWFGLVINSSPASISTFLAYFSSTYIGLSEMELRLGSEAFQQGVHIHSVQESSGGFSALDDHSFHPIISTPVQFDLDSSQPPTPSMSLSAIIEVPRWEMPLVRTPQYPIAFWNVNERALKALAKTNNALESSHYHFIKKLNHHPSMSDFLLAILNDVDKQVDIARSAATFKHQRKQKYIVKEAQVFSTLNEAEYDDDWQLLNVLTLLGLQMSGYIDGLRSTEHQPEERDTEDGVDNGNSENDAPTTSSSMFI
uniref:Dimer_Tnp_hAT domain-containing protein n=1 Tax=Meloidogyne hapla TaxID=6305 RepID=A0A1I8C003_MELHA